MRPDGILVKNEDPMYYLIPYFLTKCQENRFVSPQGGRYQMSEMPFRFINSLPVRKSFLVCR